jgi:hypothetical protein
MRVDVSSGDEWLWRWIFEYAGDTGAVGIGVCDGDGRAVAERGVVSSGHNWNDGDGYK